MPFAEFVLLMALTMSLVALSIDITLPALDQMGDELGAVHPNDVQLIILITFVGMTFGQLISGPLSDSIGRKPSVVIGILLFALGCGLAACTRDFYLLLFARFVQGFGLGAPRTVTVALIRDLYQGRAMARVVSFTMTLFIFVPMVAPALGQLVLKFSNWRAIFVFIALYALFVLAWFSLRQPETLPPDKRRQFTLGQIYLGVREVLTHPKSRLYALISGLMSGTFMAYLSVAQQVFQIQHNLGDWFALVFAGLSIPLGCASFLNGHIVVKWGMTYICLRALFCLVVLSLVCLVLSIGFFGEPPLWSLALYFSLALLALGLVFSNINALAMEPLGHIAGVGAAMIASVTNMIAVPVAILIARQYQGSVMPLIWGFAIASLISLLTLIWIQRHE